MAADATPPAEAPARERQSVQLLLRAGLALSTLLMLAGFSLDLARGALSSEAFLLHELSSSATPAGTRLMGAGICVLALTPAVRVLALLLLWMRERDWKFVFVALAVLVTLAAAVALGSG